MEQVPLNPNNLPNDTLKVKKIKHKEGTLSVRVGDGVYEKYSIPKVTYAEDVKKSPGQLLGVSLKEFQKIRSQLPEQQNLLLKYIYELELQNDPEKLSDILDCEVGELRNLTKLARENFEKIKKETLNGDFLNDLGVSGFDEFTEKYYKTILATSLRQLRKYNLKNSTSDAEDITQEIIIKLMNPKYLDKYKASTKEGKTLNAVNWLKVLTTNYTIDFLRKKNRDKADLSLENEDGEPFSNAAQSLDPLDELLVKESQEQRANLVKEVEDEIDILPQKLKQTIKLFKNGYNYSEISKQLNIPEGTVKSTIFRAKEILRKNLAIKGYQVGEKGAINRKS